MSLKVSNSLVIFILIILVIALQYYLQSKYVTAKTKIQLYEKELKILEDTIKSRDKQLLIEINRRKEDRKRDSLTIADIKSLKKKDSILHIVTINKLITKYKSYTDEKIDSLITKEYYTSTHNP